MLTFSFSSVQKWILSVSLPATIFLGYLLWKTREKDEEDVDANNATVAKTQYVVIDVMVPRHAVGAVIGKQGSIIKQIEMKTGAHIHFKGSDSKSREDDRRIQIRGSREETQQAERLVHEIIKEAPVSVELVLFVPGNTLGRIIGKGGETVRTISSSTNTKILVDRKRQGRSVGIKDILLKGLPEDINRAKLQIEELVVNGIQRDNKCAQERGDSNGLLPDIDWQIAPLYWPILHVEFFPVYVTAVEHLGHFWIQLINEEGLKLESLNLELQEYKEKHPMLTYRPTAGTYVLAPLRSSKEVYRGLVRDVIDKDVIDIYFIDYGDSQEMEWQHVWLMPNNFRQLPSQALEVCLAGVQPLGGSKEWSEEAICHFESLALKETWYTIMAKVTGFSISEDCTLPALDLVDTNEPGNDISIAQSLISEGLVLPACTQVS